MNDFLLKITGHPANQAVLKFLELSYLEGIYFRIGQEAGSPYDAGSQVLFEEYAAYLPETCRCTLAVCNLLVNPNNGQIFAFQHGRFSFGFRCDFSKTELTNSDRLRAAATLDGPVDIRSLGENWALLTYFEEEEQEQIEAAYQLSF